MHDALTQLATHGILGPIVIVLWLAYARLQKKLEETQDKRVADAESYAAKMLAVAAAVKENTAAMDDLARAIERRGESK